MKTFLAIFLNLILLMVSSPAFAQNEINLAGNWLATLDAGGVKLRLLLKIQTATAGYTAKFDSVDQDVKDLPVDSVALNGNKMSFVAAQFRMSYEGTLNDKGDEIKGTFKQGAGSTSMIFRRVGEVPMITRRQDPKKPYPYDEEEVSYRNVKDNVKLAGTLSLPRNGNRKHPAKPHSPSGYKPPCSAFVNRLMEIQYGRQHCARRNGVHIAVPSGEKDSS